MSFQKDLQDAFSNLKKRAVSTFPATVLSVDIDEGTCVVEANDLEYTEVRLASVIDDSNNKFFIFPKVQSSVLVSPINEDELQLYVEVYGEIDRLSLKIESTELDIDQAGFKFNREGENLKEVMNDLISEFGKLCDELSKVVVSIGVTPNVPVINQIKAKATIDVKERLNKILK